MLAARNGHKDIVLILTQRGASLNHVNTVRVHVDMLYYYEALVSSFWTYPGYYKNLLCILNY